MDFSIKGSVLDRTISVSVQVPSGNRYLEYAYYLYNEKMDVVQKIRYSNNNTCNFSCQEGNRFCVKVYVRGRDSDYSEPWVISKLSRIFEIHSDHEREECMAFLEHDSAASIPPLPFSKLEYPRQDLLIIKASPEKESVLRDLSVDCAMDFDRLCSGISIMTGRPLAELDSVRFGFSGMGRTNDKLLIGMDDIQTKEDVLMLSGQIGTFWLLRDEESQLILETDYFGNEKLYYYRSDDVFFVSNRIHLIILGMKALDISRIPNLDKIYAALSTNHSKFMQNFSREMDIQGIMLLPVDSKIRINCRNKELCIEKTDLFSLLSRQETFDESIYQHLLQMAANELIDNARVAFEHPGIRKFIVHVTGGLDSRLVFSVVSRFPQFRNKVVALTIKSDSNHDDFERAMQVISQYPFSFGELPYQEPVADLENQNARSLSHILGSCYHYSKRGNRVPYDGVCILPGNFGESFARVYYTRGMHKYKLGNPEISDQDFSDNLIRLHQKTQIFDGSEYMLRTFAQACLELPGSSKLEKLENHYLYYRNGLHFHIAHTADIAPEWSILQSKTLLRLKHMMYPLHSGIRLQLDMLYHMNPQIAAVGFASAQNQADRNLLHRMTGAYPEKTEFDQAVLAEVKARWEESKRNLVCHKNHHANYAEIFNDEQGLEILRFLFKTLSLDEEIVCALYQFLKNEKNATKRRNTLVKLYTLFYEFSS